MQKADPQQGQTQHQSAAKQAKVASIESPQGEHIAQLETMIESSPQAQKLAGLTAMMNNSPAMTAQRKLFDSIHNSPRQAAQKQVFDAIHNSPRQIAQKKKFDSLFGVTQRVKDEEPLQGKFTAQSPAQLEQHPAQREAAEKKSNNTGLPDNLKSGIENLSGLSMDNVKVHYNSSQPAQLNAHAYAQGTDIYVAPGQEQHLPHEAWHVVQQAQGRVQPTMQMKGGVPVNDDKGLEHEADVMGGEALQRVENGEKEHFNFLTPLNRPIAQLERLKKTKGTGLTIGEDRYLGHNSNAVIQGAFSGPPPNPNNPVNTAYPGHNFNTGGTQANTGCGGQNTIVTAGEHKNSGTSAPGTPANMTAYQYKFSRTGGLVRDPALNQASTRIHLINHRLENSGNTQNVASNILLGSKRANNPTHLHSVEDHVINALHHSSRQNANYETELAQAQTLNDADSGGHVTYWDKSQAPSTAVLPPARRENGWLDANGDVTRTQPANTGSSKKKKTSTGSVAAIAPDGYFVKQPFASLPQHLWLRYNVQANYTGAPAFVQANSLHERTQNGGAAVPTDPAIENTIQDFENDWKDNAFPANFVSSATYYQASWIVGSPYHETPETPELIATDT